MPKSVPQPKTAAPKPCAADCTETQSAADYLHGRYGSISGSIPALLWAILCEIAEVKRCLTAKK